jgi:TP901 family phage tail tape measure protein
MADQKIRKEDISENDIFGAIGASAEKNLVKIEAMDKGLIDLSEHLKLIFKKGDTSTLNGINAIIDAEKKSNILTANAIELDKQKTANKKALLDLAFQNKKAFIDEANQLKAKNKLESDSIKLKKEEEKATIKANIAQEKANKVAKEAERPYNILSTKLNNLIKDYRDLAASEGASTKSAKAQLAEIQKLDRQLKNIDASTGRGTRTVGIYGTALDGLKGKFSSITNVASGFGIALGGFSLIKGAFNTITGFETAIADLSAVTGQTGNDLDFLADKSVELSNKWGKSASDIATAFKLAGSARPELLKNGQAMVDLADKAIILAKASGDAIPDSMENLTGTLNAFDKPASDASSVMDILANAAQRGVKEIPFLTEAFSKFGGVASQAGVGVAESAAAVELLGVKIPSAETAGVSMRNILTKLQIEASKQGREFRGLTGELDLMGDKTKDVTFLSKTFGDQNLQAIQILLAQRGELKNLTESYGKVGTASEQAKINNETLGVAFERLKTNLQNVVLGVRGAGNALKPVVIFLANNIGTIVGLITKLGIAFVALKLVKLASDFKGIKEGMFGMGKASKDLAGNLTESALAGQKLGGALKNIGFPTAIALAGELVMEMYNIASGAKEAERALALLAKGRERGTKTGSERVDLIKSNTEKLIKEKESQLLKSGKTEKQILKELEAFRAKALITEKEQLQKSFDLADKKVKETAKSLEDFRTLVKKQNKGNTEEAFQNLSNAFGAGSIFGSEITKGKTLKQITTDVNAVMQEQINRRNEYANALKESTVVQEDNTLQLLRDSKATKEQTKDVKDLTEAQEDLSIALDYDQGDFEKQNQDDVDAIKEARDARYEAEDQEVIDQQARIDEALDIEGQKLSDEYDLIVESELKKDELTKEANDKKLEREKKLRDDLEKYGDEILDGFIDRSKKKEDVISKELDASKKLEDALREQANNGNADASKSLIAQENVSAKKQAQKEKEAKKQAQIEEAKIIYKSINDFMDSGDSLPKATIKGVAGSFGIRKLIESLPKFFTGTKRSVAEELGAPQLSGQDGHIVRVDGSERILTGVQNKRLGNATSNDVVDGYLMSLNNGMIIEQKTAKQEINALNPLIAEVRELSKIMENKPEITISENVRFGIARGIVVEEKRGKTRERSIYNS